MWWFNSFHPFARPFSAGWFGGWFFVPLALWSAIWTGLALWHAARRDEKGWFIFFLIVHTAGIIEIIYLLFVAKAFERSRVSQKRTLGRKRSR